MAGNPLVFGRCASSYKVSMGKARYMGPGLLPSSFHPWFLLLKAQRTNPFPLTVSPLGGEGWEDDGVQSGHGQINSERYALKWAYLSPLFRLCTFPHSLTHPCYQFMSSVTAVHRSPVSWIPLLFLKHLIFLPLSPPGAREFALSEYSFYGSCKFSLSAWNPRNLRK